jgi:hypothetical protein
MKTAIVSFFDVYPVKSGSGVVISDFFQSWPDNRKCLFQISQQNIKKKKIINTRLIKNKPIFKIIVLPLIIYKIYKYLNNSKKKILILEGASWIFYSYIVIFFLRVLLSNIFIIYRSHSIEYEIRKKNSSLFIALITRYFEQRVYSLANISTNVSNLEQKKVKKYFNIKTHLFPNSIRVNDLIKLKENKIKNLPEKYILFCGSYEYLPNKTAIDFLIKKIMPAINKKDKIFLLLTGSSPNINLNNKMVINLNYIRKSQLKFLYNNAICLIAPIFEGYGTRIKILEALTLGVNIISTPKGIEGINYKKVKRIVITNSLNKMVNSIHQFIRLKKNKKKFVIYKDYSMEFNAKKLYDEI